MNMGSAVYTEYEFDEDFVDYRMNNPETLDMQLSHLHSHNTMSTFFSGTDMSELHENAPNHNYYLSLIVNNALEMTAKIAFVGTQEVKQNVVKSFFGDNGKLYNIKSVDKKTEKVLFIYDCDISYDNYIKVPNSFRDSVNSIIAEYKDKQARLAKAKVNKNSPVQYSIPGFSTYGTSYMEEPAFKSKGPNSRTVGVESLLCDSLMLEYDSNKSLDEALFNAVTSFKSNKNYIKDFGNFIRNMANLYIEDIISLEEDFEVLDEIEELLLEDVTPQNEELIMSILTELNVETFEVENYE